MVRGFGLLRRAAVLGVLALLAGGTVLFMAGPAQAAGQFPTLASGFTQSLYGVQSVGNLFGGVAFAPNGDPLVDNCSFGGSPLYRFDSSTTLPAVHGTSTLHPVSTENSNAGCGLTDHPNGALYSDTGSGVVKLDASTGAQIGGPFGPDGNALGIAVDPQTGNLAYVESNGNIGFVNPALTTSGTLSTATSGDIDQIAYDPSGNFLFASDDGADQIVILHRDGTLARQVPLTDGSNPDGIAFHTTAPQFVVTNNNDGSMTRFDFPNNDFTQAPTQSVFASGGFRGDNAQVGPDGCLYATQDGTRYDDGTVDSSTNSLVQICPGFAPPPGVGGSTCPTPTATSSDADQFAALVCNFGSALQGEVNDLGGIFQAANFPQVSQIGTTNVYVDPSGGTVASSDEEKIKELDKALADLVVTVTESLQDKATQALVKRLLNLKEIPCSADVYSSLLGAAQDDLGAAQNEAEAAKALQDLEGQVIDGIDGAIIEAHLTDAEAAMVNKLANLLDALKKLSDNPDCFTSTGSVVRVQVVALEVELETLTITLHNDGEAIGLQPQGGEIFWGPIGTGGDLPVVVDPITAPSAPLPPIVQQNGGTLQFPSLPTLNTSIGTGAVNAGTTLSTSVGAGSFGNSVPISVGVASNPVKLATRQSNADGSFSTTVQLPANLSGGKHELYVLGTGPDGSFKAFGATITVNAIPGASPPPCSGQLTGTINGGLTIGPNMVCILKNATVNGAITVENGAVFEADSSHLNGQIIANTPGAFALCGDEVNGDVTVTHSGLPPLIGKSGLGSACAATKITGTVTTSTATPTPPPTATAS